MRSNFWRITLALLLFLVAGCSSNTGLPSRSGEYSLQPGSVCADGDRYRFSWIDQAGDVHQADAKVQRVTSDERTYLELQAANNAVLHLSQNEQIGVCPDQRGRTAWAPWIPIPIPSGPVIFDRSGERSPSGTSSQPSDDRPSLGIPKQQPAPNSVGGQSSGTGGGTAAGGKSVAPSSGQSGGTGGGSAATGKSGSSAGSAPKVTVPKAPALPKIGGGRSFGGGRK